MSSNTNQANSILAHIHLPEKVINDFHQFRKFSLNEELVMPLLDAGVGIFHLDVGGDWVTRVLNTASENYFWNAMNGMDILLCDQENQQNNKENNSPNNSPGDSKWLPVLKYDDIASAAKQQKAGVIIALGGGRPLEGKANLNLLSNLRHFHRFGVRVVQIASHGRNRSADGVAEKRTKGRLTYFGVDVVKEMTRLGMIIDSAAITDEGFTHITELTDAPLLNSRANCAALSEHPLNLSDERIKQLAATGGVMAVSFYADLIAVDKKQVEVADLVNHIEHIAALVGIEHVAIGGDVSGIDSPTPTLYERHPGIVNGIKFSERSNDYAQGLDKPQGITLIIEEMQKRNYKEDDINKVMSGNLDRIYRKVLL